MSIFNQVSVFVGGAQKSGTRSLRHYFNLHQNIAIHSKPEGHFFDRSKNFINNLSDPKLLKNYHKDFSINKETKILCDITPDYIFRKKSIERIFNYNPQATWIILLRNPIDRAYSAWNMEVNRKAENLSFEEALQSELDGGDKKRLHDRFKYIERSRYHSQLLNLWKFFPQSQCCIFSAESMWKEPQIILSKISKKLNVVINSEINYKHVHKGNYNTKMTIKAHELLESELSFELNNLSTILNWDENPWIKK